MKYWQTYEEKQCPICNTKYVETSKFYEEFNYHLGKTNNICYEIENKNCPTCKGFVLEKLIKDLIEFQKKIDFCEKDLNSKSPKRLLTYEFAYKHIIEEFKKIFYLKGSK